MFPGDLFYNKKHEKGFKYAHDDCAYNTIASLPADRP